MKYLVAGDRKVLRKGNFVSADESVGEFIFDDETVEDMKEVTVDVLKSICRNNNIPMGKNPTRGDLIINLTKNLPTLELPEQNTMSQSEVIKSIVAEAGANRKPGSDPDAFEVEVFTECIQRLNAEGITFKIKQLGNLVKKEIAEQGFIITNAQRKDQINAILTEAEFRPEEWDEVEAMIERLTKEVGDTERGQALSAIRRYLKAEEFELPKRTKKAKKAFRDRVVDFMIANSPVADDALLAFVIEAGKKEEDAPKVVERLESLRKTIDAAYAAGLANAAGESAEAA